MYEQLLRAKGQALIEIDRKVNFRINKITCENIQSISISTIFRIVTELQGLIFAITNSTSTD
jgi:hypothetical protein